MATTKRTTKTRTACGRIATPIEGEPLKWLVRKSLSTWYVIELWSYEARIQDIDLDHITRETPIWISATAHKLTKKYDEATSPGWWVEVYGNCSDRPYSRMADAIAGMLAEIAQDRRLREERAAERRQTATAEPETEQPTITERHTELRTEWSRIWLVTEYIDKADTAEYRAAHTAAHDASQEMVRRGLWRSPIGPSSTDPSWETWYEIALDIHDTEIVYLQRQEA